MCVHGSWGAYVLGGARQGGGWSWSAGEGPGPGPVVTGLAHLRPGSASRRTSGPTIMAILSRADHALITLVEPAHEVTQTDDQQVR